jgi:hypothetical protein
MGSMTIEKPNPDFADPSLRRMTADLAKARWSKQAASDWYSKRSWPCGFNYLPASAINFVEMWQEESFDPEGIDRELGWAAEYGFNALRTNLPFIVWQNDRDGLIGRVGRFLEIASRHGLDTMICLLDDCEFSGHRPKIGKQPQLIEGVHNGGAVGSPGRELVMDSASWPNIKRYVSDIVTRFKSDDRISVWDIYNEPGNRLIFSLSGEHLYDLAFEEASHRLMLKAFGWCREIAPSQPLTTGPWRVPPPDEELAKSVYEHPTDVAAIEISDVISFHAYTPLTRMRRIIAELSELGRPLFCTEWMARHAGSTIAEQLPLMAAAKIGAFQWGLVNGRTQTHLPWPQLQAGSAMGQGKEWFHDFLRQDGTPYSQTEAALIGKLAARNRII